MRPLTDEETEMVFKKLAHYIGENVRLLIERDDGTYCFRLHKERVYYCSEALLKKASLIAREPLLSFGTCLGKFTHSKKFHLHITGLDYLAPYAKWRVWLKPNAEQQFLYGNNVLKSGVGRMTEGTESHQGVVVYSMNDMPLGFGVTAKSTTECRRADPTAIFTSNPPTAPTFQKMLAEVQNSTSSSHHQFHWSEPEWKSTLTKLHGVVFIIAWMFLVPIAMASARYFRDTLTKHTPMGLRIWFHVHRTFNVIAAVLMIIGLVAIFVVHEWKWLGPKVGGTKNNSATTYHTMFGLFSVLLAWIQPFNSLLRCGPTHRLRPLFNWSHRVLGLTAWVFAVTTIMIACKYFGKWDFINAHMAVTTCAVTIGVFGLTILISELIVFRSRDQKRDPEKTHWSKFMLSTVISFASVTLIILVTILCVLIGVKQ